MPPNLAEPSPSHGSDLSKNAILVLLVLTIFVSAFGTWLVLRATENVGVPLPPESQENIGVLSVSILGRGEAPLPPPIPHATGFMAVDIVRNDA